LRQGSLYLLGHSEDEELRLRRQSEELQHESTWLFDRIGLGRGVRAIDLGCGPQGVLDLLSQRVGSNGHVIGIERNRESVAMAKRFVVDRALKNVEVVQGDATATGLPGARFDLVHARLVLVNVPYVEAVVREMLRLARPGGMVASHEADYLSHFCDPPLAPGIVFLRSSKRTLPRTGSTFLLAAERTACSIKPGWWISK
jgi:ubiquinone/menaquinone biosynthesis C-methylase UbiE